MHGLCRNACFWPDFLPVTNSKFSKGASFFDGLVSFTISSSFRQYGTRHGVADVETAIHARVGAGIRDVKRQRNMEMVFPESCLPDCISCSTVPSSPDRGGQRRVSEGQKQRHYNVLGRGHGTSASALAWMRARFHPRYMFFCLKHSVFFSHFFFFFFFSTNRIAQKVRSAHRAILPHPHASLHEKAERTFRVERQVKLVFPAEL